MCRVTGVGVDSVYKPSVRHFWVLLLHSVDSAHPTLHLIRRGDQNLPFSGACNLSAWRVCLSFSPSPFNSLGYSQGGGSGLSARPPLSSVTPPGIQGSWCFFSRSCALTTVFSPSRAFCFGQGQLSSSILNLSRDGPWKGIGDRMQNPHPFLFSCLKLQGLPKPYAHPCPVLEN